MKKLLSSILFIVVLMPIVCFGYGNNYPLELIHPKAGLTGHRINKAYTGVEYNIRSAVIGGKYPYTYTISNEPSGMTINGGTGEIIWTNPQSTASNITVRATDQDGDFVEGTWSITVGTSGFVFVAPGGSDTTGDGSIGNPYETFNFALNNSASTDFLYFRTGTYAPNSSGDNFIFSTTPGVFMEYPGDSVVFDLDPENDDVHLPRIGINRSDVWFDGITIRNAYEQMFYLNGGADNMTFRRLDLSDVDYGTSSNESFFRIEYAATGGGYFTVQDCWMDDTEDDPANLHDVKAMSLYSFRKMLIEDNAFTRIAHTFIDVKEGLQQYTIRHNTFSNWGDAVSGQPMTGVTNDDRNTGVRCDGEILFNFIKNQTNSATGTTKGDQGTYINSDRDFLVSGAIYIERNTFYSVPVINAMNSTVGPFYFSDNVIVNDMSESDGDATDKIWNQDGTDDNRLIRVGSVTAAPSDNAIDSDTGLLLGTYRDDYLGIAGWETTTASSGETGIAATGTPATIGATGTPCAVGG